MGLSDIFGVGLGIGLILAIIAVVIICLLIVPFILMICWNFVMPGLFGLPELNIWTSLALWLVFCILTGGIRASCKSN